MDDGNSNGLATSSLDTLVVQRKGLELLTLADVLGENGRELDIQNNGYSNRIFLPPVEKYDPNPGVLQPMPYVDRKYLQLHLAFQAYGLILPADYESMQIEERMHMLFEALGFSLLLPWINSHGEIFNRYFNLREDVISKVGHRMGLSKSTKVTHAMFMARNAISNAFSVVCDAVTTTLYDTTYREELTRKPA